MKYLTLLVALALSACGGFESRQAFLQEQGNEKKFYDLQARVVVDSECEKLDKLYNFAKLESPTVDDLAEIMPVFGLQQNDAKDMNKMHTMGLLWIKSLNCTNKGNVDALVNEAAEYCNSKYIDDKSKQKECKIYLNSAIYSSDNYRKKESVQAKTKERFYIDNYQWRIFTDWLVEQIDKGIKQIYPIPKYGEYLLPIFTASELVKANSTKLGVHDSDYCEDDDYGRLCDKDTRIVTRLNAADVLYSFCVRQVFWPSDEEATACACYAHEAYKNITYKQLIYVFEQKELPQSKQAEYAQLLAKCNRKLEQQRQKEQKERYGETSADKTSDTNNNVLIEALENAAWAHRTLTDARKAAENE